MIEQPTWRFGENGHTDAKHDTRNHLETPWDTEGRDTINIGAAELNEVLDKDTPGDRPLLERYETTADAGLSDFGLVDGDNGRCDPNCQTSDHTPCDEHATVLNDA